MLRKKIAVSILVFLFIMSAGLLIHTGIKQERRYYFMPSPVHDGMFRNYSSTNNDEISKFSKSYIPYSPREYVKIIDKKREHTTYPFDK